MANVCQVNSRLLAEPNVAVASILPVRYEHPTRFTIRGLIPTDTGVSDTKLGHEYCVINNYFGIGLDAKISLDFNTLRDENPDKFRYISY